MSTATTTTATKKEMFLDQMVERIIALIEKGENPMWVKPWKNSSGPNNPITGTFYSGFNVFWLRLHNMFYGLSDSRFITFNQAQTLWAKHKKVGSFMEKGTKSCSLMKYDVIQKTVEKDGKNEVVSIPFFNTFNVFNIQQFTPQFQALIAEIYPIEVTEQVTSDIEKDEFFSTYMQKNNIAFTNGDKAYFSPSQNLICMPKFEQFNSSIEYYSTFAHECIHSTGQHLNRDMSGKFGDTKYAFEELVAEMGASIVCSHLGMEFEGKSENNQTAYLVGWGKRFKNNPSLLWDALKAAQKAAQFITE